MGTAFIPWAGVQIDEALFATPLFIDSPEPLPTGIPPMVLSYLGTLKTHLYKPVFAIFGTSIWALRLPVLLAGAATIFIFFRLVGRSQGPLAASLAAVILATDPVFLLTHTFDWGPVALQILLTTAGISALYRFGRAGRVAWLALGFLCFGLALWNKALVSWILLGFGLGALVYGREIARRLSVRNVAISLVFLVLGAGPLLLYNWANDFATLSENTRLVPGQLAEKSVQVPNALLGNSLFGFLVNEKEAEAPKPASSVSEWLRNTVGERRDSFFLYVIAGMLLAVPVWWRSRAAWFAILAFGAGWLAMALTEGAGGAAHHVILLWPLPVLFAAVVLERVRKWIAMAIGGAVVFGNLLVLHQYLYQFERYGAAPQWTDAMFPLTDALRQWDGKTFYVTDWGMIDSLILAHRGRVPLRIASGELSADDPNEAERRSIDFMLADPNAIFVGHARPFEIYPNVGKHLEEHARRAGRRVEILRTITDSNGRGIFELSRMVADAVP